MSNKYVNEVSVSDLLNILRVRWLVILIVGVFVATVTFCYYNFFVEEQYRASAQMFVDTRKESSEGKDTYINSTHIVAAKELANTYIHVIKTNTILDTVIDELGLNMSYSQLYSRINISVVEDTQMLRISVVDANRERALSIVTKIVEIAPDMINGKIDSGKLISIDRPSVSSAPVSPNVPVNTAIGFVAGIFVSFAFYLVSHLLDNKFKSGEDIQKILDIPVLGVIPSLEHISSK